MTEYPPPVCGPCPHLAHFEKARKTGNSLLPEPVVDFHRGRIPQDPRLGVPSGDIVPDLRTSPIKQSKDDQFECCLKEQSNKKPTECPDQKEYALPESANCCNQSKKGILKNNKSGTQLQGTKEDTQPIRKEIKFAPDNNNNNNNDSSKCCQDNDRRQLSGGNRVEPMSSAETALAMQDDPAFKSAPDPKTESNPCYLPQPEDELTAAKGDMGPIGPWATGRVDWGPLSGLTGTRPVVDKYSISRFSEGEWRAHNKEMLEIAGAEIHKANLIDWNGRQCLQQTSADTDKNQEDNTKRLMQREQEVHRWKCELERAISAASEEITFMEEQRHRLKQASSVLQLPESIAGECLERRTGRLDPELVRDEVEEELIKELALCAEIRDIFNRTLKDVEAQLLEDKTAKQRLEYDWSDKKIAHELEAINVALNCRSTVLLFKPGSVIFPDNQSTHEYWEHFTRETLMEGEATRQRSVALRGTLDAILTNAARDLRSQADRVELALSKKVSCTEQVTVRLENDLKQILQRLADVESLINDLRAAIRRMDFPMKKVQTRLDNRLLRPRVENCRDEPHYGLIEEVKTISESVAALQAQLNQAEESQANLMKARSDLEREILVKRKTLEIDRERTQLIRSYYPSAAALSGH